MTVVLRRLPRWAVRLRATTAAVTAAAAAAALLCAAPAWAADAPAAQPDHSVRAPHHGDVLFHFYQDEYFNAISSLMVSQHFQRLAPHDDEAEVLRGGLLLSWGMHAQAGAVFEKLIAHNASPAVRDRAWFFLAKVRHARGLHDEAFDALSRIEHTLPESLDAERSLLLAQVYLALGDNTNAAKLLTPLAGTPPSPGTPQALLDDPTRYARFNLGVALVREGQREAGQAWLDALGRSPAGTEEQRALRDQTNLALGFAALQRQQPEPALQWLERVRLQGPHSNKALLALGWASLGRQQAPMERRAAPERHDPLGGRAGQEPGPGGALTALVPWQELLQREPSDPAVQEARIALPFALAELDAPAEALQQYQQALAEYQLEDGRLGESITALKTGPWLDELLRLNPGAGLGWVANLSELPRLPHSRQLAATLAGHPFQEGFKALRDLRFLAGRLQQWQEKLAGYQDMLALRQQTFAQKLPAVQQQAQQIDLAGLQVRHSALAAELAQAREAADGVAFATPRERDLLQRVARTRSSLAATAPGLPEGEVRNLAATATTTKTTTTTSTAERVRLLAGLLSWDLAQAAPERQWQAEKALTTLDTQREQAQQRLAALEQAQREQAGRFAQLGQRITVLNQQIQALLPQLDRLGLEEATALQALAVADLQSQQQRLAAYSTQARYAMAQLQDRARQTDATTPQDEHAAPR